MFSKYVSVNKRDLNLAIQEGLRPMHEFFDTEKMSLPFFGNNMTAGKDFGNSHHNSFSLSHIPGRWLAALLNAEEILNISVDELAIDNLRTWAYNSLEGANILFPSCMDTKTMRYLHTTDLHNLREVMHAFYALIMFRRDSKAVELGTKLIDAVDTYYDYKNGVFLEEAYNRDIGAEALCCATMPGEKYPFPPTFGRYIGPLVKFFKATSYDKALRQAIRLKDVAFTKILNERGDYDVKVFGSHTHSTTSMLSSLAQLYEVTKDKQILDRIVAFMDNGLKEIALDFGWCIENETRKDMVGEINNTSDIMECCLILGEAGYPGYYARAERILRSHLLPAQLLDVSFIPNDDVLPQNYHLADRSLGAFGFPCPFGHEDQPGARISFNWDIVGGGVLGLCIAKRQVVTKRNNLFSINLLFDTDTEDLIFSNPYTRGGRAILTMKCEASVRVRIPTRSDRERISADSEWFIDGEWLYLEKPMIGQPIKIDLCLKETTESFAFRDKRFQMRFWGEEVTGVTSHGKRLCFFEEIDGDQNL